MSSQAHSQKPHIVPLRTYLLVAGALYLLTLLTVAVSYIHLGGWNVVIALFIAGIKASLVALIFMHLWYDQKVYAIVFLTAIVFLALLITFTMFDNMTRGSINEIRAEPIHKEAEMYSDSTRTSHEGAMQEGESAPGTEAQGAEAMQQADSAAAHESAADSANAQQTNDSTGAKENSEGH